MQDLLRNYCVFIIGFSDHLHLSMVTLIHIFIIYPLKYVCLNSNFEI